MAARPIVIGIQGDASNLSRALRKASGEVAGFAGKVGRLGAQAGVAFGAAAVAIGVQGVRAAADFETSMREVMTLLPGVGDTVFGELSDQVKTFSKEFGVMPEKVVPALYQALSAGVPKDNVFEFLEVAQQAAKGGVTDLETAVDGITSVVNAYGSEVISAAEASDLMFTAVRLGKTDFGQLSASLFQVAPIAAGVGVDFQDVTAALANLTAQGVPTRVAATQLRGAFAELAKEGSVADAAFRELSGKGFAAFVADGGDVQQAFQIMADGAETSGVSVLDLFGSIEAGQAVLALTADGGESFAATLAEMGSSAGATEAAFGTMDQGMAANFDRIKANLAVLTIEIGEKLAPVVLAASDFIVDHFDEMVEAVLRVKDSAVDLVKKHWPLLQKSFEKTVKVVKRDLLPVLLSVGKFMQRAGKFVLKNRDAFMVLGAAVLGAVIAFKVLAGLKKVLAFFKAMQAAVIALNVAMAANPVGVVVIALAALAAAAVLAYRRFETFRDIADAVWRFLSEDLRPVFELVATTAREQIQIIVDVFDLLWSNIKLVVDLVKAIFEGDFAAVWTNLKALALGVLEGLFLFMFDLPTRILREVLPKLAGALLSLGTDAMASLWDGATALWDESVLPWFKDLPGLIVGGLGTGLDLLVGWGTDLIKGMWNGILDGLDWLWETAKGVPDAIADFFLGKKDGPTALASSRVFGPTHPALGDWSAPGSDPAALQRLETALAAEFGFLPKMRSGGVVTGPTLALLGDNPSGMEAIVPLERAGEMGFGGATINLTVNAGLGTNGQHVGAEIITALKTWQRSNGVIPVTTS